MSTQDIIEDIIRMEWEMMQAVTNEGGRASCQEDREAFFFQRRAQFSVWSDVMCDIYHRNLQQAMMKGENLITLKYAYMMKYTAPEAYAAFADSLPVVSEEAEALIDEIVPIQVAWQKEVLEKYRGKIVARPLHQSEDTPENTSFETYLRSELATYSVPLLRVYASHMAAAEVADRNLAMEVTDRLINK